jgi:hypothetical protein
MRMRTIISDALWWHTLTRHHSRLFYTQARRFTRYLRHCRRIAPVTAALPAAVQAAVDRFAVEGYAAFRTDETEAIAAALLERVKQEEAAGLPVWDDQGRYALDDPLRRFQDAIRLFSGSVGLFLNGVYGTHFKLHSGVLLKSSRTAAEPEGSQLWHADGGPGTCINVMVTLSETTPQNGAMKCLPWRHSLALFRHERPIIRRRLAAALAADPKLDRLGQRKVKCDFYREEIDARHSDNVAQPTGAGGIVYAFRNNLLHGGGFCEPGHERYVYIFHAYPADKPAPLDRYRAAGAPKLSSHFMDPADE